MFALSGPTEGYTLISGKQLTFNGLQEVNTAASEKFMTTEMFHKTPLKKIQKRENTWSCGTVAGE